MISYFRISFILCLLLLRTSLASAQEEPYAIHKRLISQTEGLPDRNVNCGIQDKFGFLWFGTRSGLCYYDGTEFTFLTKKSHGLRGTSILSLSADDSLGIIISYLAPGSSAIRDVILDVVNIKTKEVTPFNKYYPTAPFSEEEINEIIYVNGKSLRLLTGGTRDSVWTYSGGTGFERKPLKSLPINIKIPDIETENPAGLARLHSWLINNIKLLDDGTLLAFFLNPKVIFDPQEGFLISYDDLLTSGTSLIKLDLHGNLTSPDSNNKLENKIKGYSHYGWSPHNTYNHVTLSPYNDNETAIIETPERNVLFYSPETKFTKIFGREENIKVRSYFKDRLGTRWLCTNVGIYKVTLTRKVFKNYFTRDIQRFSFNNSARGIYMDDDVQCFNLYDSPVIIMKGDTIMPGTEQNFAVVRDGDILWIGEYYMFKFDMRSRKLLYKAPSLMAEVWSIFKLNHHQLLLGCTRGLALYDIEKDVVSEISYGEYPPARFGYKIFRNSQGNIMAATENGIYILSDTATIIDYFSSQSETSDKRLPFTGVQDVYEDKDGIYWIASGHEGLFQWNKEKHTFRQFGIESGFLSTVVYCIQEDDHNNLWVSTDYGLTRFNKASQKAITYTKEDGIADNEFNRTSSFKDKHGHLYFGGMNGITSIDPNDFLLESIEKKYDFPLTSFRCINSSTGLQEDKMEQIQKEGKVVLHENIKSFTVTFSLLDYESRQHRYSYKLEDVDKDWNYIDDGRLQLGSLPYQDYKLRIRAQLSNGDWYDREIVAWITVVPPFYKTWWFISLSGFVLLAGVILTIKIRTRILKNKNLKLEEIIEERTHELQTSLDEQKAMMQEIHHRVKNNLQFIEAIIAMQTNISKEESDQAILMDINRRINAMTLVHEMLYTRDKLETISVKEYINELIDKLRGMVDSNNTPVEFDIEVEDIHFNINNCLAIGMISTELISNSLKHAFGGISHPIVTIRMTRNANAQTIRYTVKDNGPGLPENKHKHGLGMRLIDIFARQLRGKYSLQNQDGLLFAFEFAPHKR